MYSRSEWPRRIRRGSTDASVLGLRVQFPPMAWNYVSWDCCLLSGRGLCVGLITRLEQSECSVSVCDREASTVRRPWPVGGLLLIAGIRGLDTNA